MADAASLAFQNTWAMDAASNLSKTIDRSRPAPRVCRRTGACPACKQQQLRRSRSTASGLLQTVLSSNTSLSGLPTCLVLYFTALAYARTHAWPGITSLGGGEDTASHRLRHVSHRAQLVAPASRDQHCLAAWLLCLPSRLRRQPTPAQLQRAEWLGSRGPCFSIPGLNLDRARFQSCIPGQKPPLLQSSQRLSCLHWFHHFD